MSLGAKFVEVEGAADASSAGGYAVEQTEEYKQNNNRELPKVWQNLISLSPPHKFGEKSLILITEEMLNSMRDGSVIIDLAASTGGNTPHTKTMKP